MAEEDSLGKLLSFEDAQRKRVSRAITTNLKDQYGRAGVVAEEFAEVLSEDPLNSIRLLPSFLARARGVVRDRAFVEAIAGGPNPDFTAPIINLVGVIYPGLPRDARREALSLVLNGFLDTLNSRYASEQVASMDEPWLIADIIISRGGLYMPPWQEYLDLLAKYPNWKELYPNLSRVRSAFFLSFAVAQNNSTPEIQDNYSRVFPSLWNRTLDAIAAFTHVSATRDSRRESSTTYEHGIEQRLFRYHPPSRVAILTKIKHENWIHLD